MAITAMAAFVKGAVGFAMPVIMISGLSSFLSPELALAGLIVPTLLANVWQVLRGGLRNVAGVVRLYWRYLVVVLVFIAGSAQLITVLPAGVLYLIVGVPISAFAVLQLAGWSAVPPRRGRRIFELATAALAGFVGGLSGVWGPPTVAYLTAINAPKRESIRVQGVVYASGGMMLLLAHLQSGVLRAETLPLSLVLVVPMLLGMWAGFQVQDRLDQVLFRRAVLVVLTLVGLNLVRRGVIALI